MFISATNLFGLHFEYNSVFCLKRSLGLQSNLSYLGDFVSVHLQGFSILYCFASHLHQISIVAERANEGNIYFRIPYEYTYTNVS